jgi:hypothetical protein
LILHLKSASSSYCLLHLQSTAKLTLLCYLSH